MPPEAGQAPFVGAPHAQLVQEAGGATSPAFPGASVSMNGVGQIGAPASGPS